MISRVCPNGHDPFQLAAGNKVAELPKGKVEFDCLLGWQDEGGQIADRVDEGELLPCRNTQSNLRGVRKIQIYMVEDALVYWTYGNEKIVAFDDKGLSGKPCFYYVNEANEHKSVPAIGTKHVIILRVGIKTPNNNGKSYP